MPLHPFLPPRPTLGTLTVPALCLDVAGSAPRPTMSINGDTAACLPADLRGTDSFWGRSSAGNDGRGKTVRVLINVANGH